VQPPIFKEKWAPRYPLYLFFPRRKKEATAQKKGCRSYRCRGSRVPKKIFFGSIEGQWRCNNFIFKYVISP
jgi:hypothetical protein